MIKSIETNIKREQFHPPMATGLLLALLSCFRILSDTLLGNSGLGIDLLTTVKRRKLKWYWHVTRSSGLAKTILQGSVQEGRRRGRQKKRWKDNIPEWTGMTLGAAMRKAERREEWRELVARSSVAPQRSTKTTG